MYTNHSLLPGNLVLTVTNNFHFVLSKQHWIRYTSTQSKIRLQFSNSVYNLENLQYTTQQPEFCIVLR